VEVTEWKGAVHIILTSAAAALLALAISVYFPSIIPTSAGTVKL
jgi:hypothetical protein